MYKITPLGETTPVDSPEIWLVNFIVPSKIKIMSKNRFLLNLSIFALLISTITMSCEKNNENCETCKALNTNGSVHAEKQVCSDADRAAFAAANSGKEIVCN
jgi:hypothetical protein